MVNISLQTSHLVSAFSSEILIELLITSRWSPRVYVLSAKIQILILVRSMHFKSEAWQVMKLDNLQ